jgi:hypothetical protein
MERGRQRGTSGCSLSPPSGERVGERSEREMENNEFTYFFLTGGYNAIRDTCN